MLEEGDIYEILHKPAREIELRAKIEALADEIYYNFERTIFSKKAINDELMFRIDELEKELEKLKGENDDN